MRIEGKNATTFVPKNRHDRPNHFSYRSGYKPQTLTARILYLAGVRGQEMKMRLVDDKIPVMQAGVAWLRDYGIWAPKSEEVFKAMVITQEMENAGFTISQIWSVVTRVI